MPHRSSKGAAARPAHPSRRTFLMSAAAASAALGIGVGLVWNRTARAPQGVIFDADFVQSRFFAPGQSFADETSFLAAIGGETSGNLRTIGPHIAADAPELLINGDFSAGTTGWTPSQSGGGPATGAVVGGEYVLSGNNANSAFLGQPVAVQQGHAYQLRGKVKRGTTLNASPLLHVTSNANGNTGGPAYSQGPGNSTTSFIESVRTFCPIGALGSIYVGMRAIANPADGTSIADDFSVKDCAPFAGFVPGILAGLVTGITPAAASGSKVVLQFDDGALSFDGTPTERNYARLFWDAGKHLHLLVTYQATVSSTTVQADFDLGVVDVSTSFRVAFSLSADAFCASLDGRPALTSGPGSMPGFAQMRICKSQQPTANNWDGTVERVTLFGGTRTTVEVENLAAVSLDGLVAAWGDSLTQGSGASDGAHGYPAVAAALFNPDRAVSSQGIGGQTSTQIAARMGAQPLLVTVAANQIPASGGVAVTAKNINILYAAGSYSGSNAGTLAGIRGLMTTDASGNWTFTRTSAGSVVDCPGDSAFLPELAALLRPRIAWLWLGRNGAQAGHSVDDDIAAAVASLGHQRYLVGGILTSASDNPDVIAGIQALNADLAATYGSRFVDLYALLRAAGDGSANDLADIAAGYIPRSRRSDAIHLNDAGYAIVAAALQAATIAKGW